MKQTLVTIAISPATSAYRIEIGSGLIENCGPWARQRLGREAAKIVIFSNPTVLKLYGEAAAASLMREGFAISTYLMRDGERYKTLKTVTDALKNFSGAGITRTDGIVALGGGVVGDAAGFAASIHLRGVRVLQIPTTLLAMVDSSVGGKTGVNGEAGKNSIGAFHQPSGVLVDIRTLATLDERHINAGFFEAAKHGFLAGGETLEEAVWAIRARDAESMRAMIHSSVLYKAAIVSDDEREASSKRNSKSRKVLNFGHTLAHALEKVTNYRVFLHGEAVAYGMLFAAELSKSVAKMPQKDVNVLYDVVQSVGSLPSLANIDPREVFEAFRFDKKNQAGDLQMILLRGIGKPVVINTTQIPARAFTAAFRRLLEFQR